MDQSLITVGGAATPVDIKEEPSSAGGRLANGVKDEFPDRWALAPSVAFRTDSELSLRDSIGARLLPVLSTDGETESDNGPPDTKCRR